MDNKKRQKLQGLMTIVLVFALLVGGSLAWQDVTQHKTNVFESTSIQHNVTLVENFEAIQEWKRDQEVPKQVSVRNGQKNDDTSQFTYDDAYVRIQFKEFMGVSAQSYVYSDHRFMIDTKGEFIRDVDKTVIEKYMQDNEIPDDARIEQVKGYFDDEPYYYIATQKEDINGQYGKFVVMSVDLDAQESIITGKTNNSDAADTEHQDYPNREDEYTPHLWENGKVNSAKESEFTKYVSWRLGADVITIDQWNGAPVAKWILDTSSTEGWAYWGENLIHGTSVATTPKSLTSNLLESVTLTNNPEGPAQYYIHVNLDAVSYEDLVLWDDAPDSIKEAYSGLDEWSISRRALKESIDKANSYELGTIKTPMADALRDQLVAANKVYNNPNATKDQIDAAKVALDQAVEDFLNDPVSAGKVKLVEHVRKAQAADRTGKHEQSVERLDVALTEGLRVMNSATTNLDEINSAVEGLEKTLYQLVDHKLENFGGHTWTVLHVSEDNKVLIIVDSLTDEDYSKMGIVKEGVTSDDKSYPSSSYSHILAKSVYPNSNLEKIDKAFYNTFIASSNDVQAVLPVKFNLNAKPMENFRERTDDPTIVSNDGTYTAFSLSASDINVYEIRLKKMEGAVRFWLRSPGRSDTTASIIFTDMTSMFDRTINQVGQGVRPALWIDLDKVDLGNR